MPLRDVSGSEHRLGGMRGRVNQIRMEEATESIQLAVQETVSPKHT